MGLAFAAAAGAGLAEVTTATKSAAGDLSSTTATTGTQTTGSGMTSTAPPSTTLPTVTTLPVTTTPPPKTTVPTSTAPPTVPPTTVPTTTETETGNGQPKVVICHHTGSKKHPWHTITVAEPAVQAHLANHRDTVGPCPAATTSVGTSTMTPGVATTAPTTVGHTKKPKHAAKPKTHGHPSSHGHHGSTPTHVKSHGPGHGNSGGDHGNAGGNGKGNGK